MAITVTTVIGVDAKDLGTKLATALATHVALSTFSVVPVPNSGEWAAFIFTVTP